MSRRQSNRRVPIHRHAEYHDFMKATDQAERGGVTTADVGLFQADEGTGVCGRNQAAAPG